MPVIIRWNCTVLSRYILLAAPIGAGTIGKCIIRSKVCIKLYGNGPDIIPILIAHGIISWIAECTATSKVSSLFGGRNTAHIQVKCNAYTLLRYIIRDVHAQVIKHNIRQNTSTCLDQKIIDPGRWSLEHTGRSANHGWVSTACVSKIRIPAPWSSCSAVPEMLFYDDISATNIYTLLGFIIKNGNFQPILIAANPLEQS